MEFPFHSVVSLESETEAIAKSFAELLKPGDLIVLSGELGAGKTFFIKKALTFFGITWVSSPSFAIVNEYQSRYKFYHIDFFRVNSAKELFDIGIDDYFNDKMSICFVEWGSLFQQVLPKSYYKIAIEMISAERREISIKYNE